MRKNHWIGSNDSELTKTCINCFCIDIKKSYLIIKKKVSRQEFDSMPENVKLINGSVIPINEYYIQSDRETDRFVLNPTLKISKTDRRCIQYQIAQYQNKNHYYTK